jgi:hypothetical protein
MQSESASSYFDPSQSSLFHCRAKHRLELTRGKRVAAAPKRFHPVGNKSSIVILSSTVSRKSSRRCASDNTVGCSINFFTRVFVRRNCRRLSISSAYRTASLIKGLWDLRTRTSSSEGDRPELPISPSNEQYPTLHRPSSQARPVTSQIKFRTIVLICLERPEFSSHHPR